ncbi:hypothetical protein DL93DRAFT_2097689 [Clavulina sp. PMI_390]|nr:hypothetical protein DL93DRAFT_2097689 [Clavulina sp. PMI_390]
MSLSVDSESANLWWSDVSGTGSFWNEEGPTLGLADFPTNHVISDPPNGPGDSPATSPIPLTDVEALSPSSDENLVPGAAIPTEERRSASWDTIDFPESEEDGVVSLLSHMAHDERANNRWHFKYEFLSFDEDETVQMSQSPTSASIPASNVEVVNVALLASQLSLARTASISSTVTILQYGALQLSLSELCALILAVPSLARSEILSVEAYYQPINRFLHRFLVLHLSRHGKKDVFLRLDRRTNASRTKLFFSSSVPASDEATLSPTKSRLIPSDAKRENRLAFPPSQRPTLYELQIFLSVIIEEMVIYKVWPENCWFFCSLVQQHLARAEDSYFDIGSLQHPNLARNVRNQIQERVRKIFHEPQRPSITVVLRFFISEGKFSKDPDMDMLLTTALNASIKFKDQKAKYGGVLSSSVENLLWGTLPLILRLAKGKDLTSAILVGGQVLQEVPSHIWKPLSRGCKWQLAQFLRNHAEYLMTHKRLSIACHAAEESLQLHRELCLKLRPLDLKDLMEELRFLGRLYGSSRRYVDAQRVIVERAMLARLLSEGDHTSLGDLHKENASVLTRLTRWDEARSEFELALKHFRSAIKTSLDSDSPRVELNLRIDIVFTITGFSGCLADAWRHEKALAVLEEAIKHTKIDSDPSSLIGARLAIEVLRQQSRVLAAMDRFQEACLLDQDTLIFCHAAGFNDYDKARTFAAVWKSHGDHLRGADRFSESLEASQQSLVECDKAIELFPLQDHMHPDVALANKAELHFIRMEAFSSLGRYSDALPCIAPCANDLREHPARVSSHYTAELALYVREHGRMLIHTHAYTAAVVELRKAADLLRRLVVLGYMQLAVSNRLLAITLLNIASALTSLGLQQEARSVLYEGLSMAQASYSVHREQNRSLMAETFTWYSRSFLHLDADTSPAEGISYATEGVNLHRVCYSTRPRMYSRELAEALAGKGRLHVAARQEGRAVTAFTEALTVIHDESLIERARKFLAADERNGPGSLASQLFSYGLCSIGAKTPHNGIEALREARDIYSQLVSSEEDGDWHRSSLAECSLAFAECSFAMRSFEDTIEGADEALAIFKQLHAEGPRTWDEYAIRCVWIVARATFDSGHPRSALDLLEREAEVLALPLTTTMDPDLLENIQLLRTEIDLALMLRDTSSANISLP